MWLVIGILIICLTIIFLKMNCFHDYSEPELLAQGKIKKDETGLSIGGAFVYKKVCKKCKKVVITTHIARI